MSPHLGSSLHSSGIQRWRKGGCKINNKRSVQAEGKGTVGRWRDGDKTFRNGCKSTGIEERCWQGVTEGKKGE